MKIVMFDGALCNQMTQYIFARCLQEELKNTNELVLLDDLWFYCEHGDVARQVESIEHHKFQLDKFPNIYPVMRTSQYFGQEMWQEIVEIARSKPELERGSYLPQILKDKGLNFFMIAETKWHKEQFDGMVSQMPHYYYIPEMLQSKGNTYYFGWFTHGEWFQRHRDMFLHEFELPPLWQPHDLEMQEKIRKSTAVSLHIRRGGYAAVGRATSVEYFQQTIAEVCQHLKTTNYQKEPCFFVFSDEIEWVKEHMEEYGIDKIPYSVEFCQPNRTLLDNHCDIQLMAQCDIMILERRSVYSYMAALLNQKENKIVINPNKGRGVF